MSSVGYAACNFHWRIVAELMVEQGGEWTTSVFTAAGDPVKAQVSAMHRPHQRHRIAFAWPSLQVRPCATNLRVVVWAVNPYGHQEGAGVSSPETHATCKE